MNKEPGTLGKWCEVRALPTEALAKVGCGEESDKNCIADQIKVLEKIEEMVRCSGSVGLCIRFQGIQLRSIVILQILMERAKFFPDCHYLSCVKIPERCIPLN